jgi:hypothetical protein
VRLDVNFGVSYEADPHKVNQLAIEAAMGIPAWRPTAGRMRFLERSVGGPRYVITQRNTVAPPAFLASELYY